MLGAVSTADDSIFDDEPAPLDESELLGSPAPEASSTAAELAIDTRFVLRRHITPVQHAFLERNGFLVFARVASLDEVKTTLGEIDRVAQKLLDEGIERICGVPAWFGKDPEGRPMLQRMGFSSYYSDWLEDFVRDDRFEPVRQLIGEHARIATREKDGVVFNRYINLEGSLRTDLAWHTDGLRDVFYNRKMPGPMLNVGLHFERVRHQDGGLRLLPGTHRQGVWSMLFRKIQFLSRGDDADEVMVETWPGDLTVHDGRAWHRVKISDHQGWASLRHSMYVPYVVDAFQPKDDATKTNLYMRLFHTIMKAKGANR